MSIVFQSNPGKPYLIAGPCTAESKDLCTEVADFLTTELQPMGFNLVFKASFDKANRTSIHSTRGPGLEKVLGWFEEIKATYKLPILTDVHETYQVSQVAQVCDVLQIPAFLCRQTDLIRAAVETGKAVNVKKGQFLPPGSTKHIVDKVREIAAHSGIAANLALTERGNCFGHGDLIVDMRGFQTMAATGAAVIYDGTHSLQQPSGSQETGGLRSMAPALARAAVATGYVDGLFIEVHPEPSKAASDRSTQLSFGQAGALVRTCRELFSLKTALTAQDDRFKD